MALSKREIERRIKEEKLVSDFVDLKTQLQPASFDLTAAKVFEFENAGALDFDNSERKLSDGRELSFNADGWLELKKGAYRVQFNEAIKLPSGLAALSISRSSLARCGCVVSTGWWDPSYEGKGACVLIVGNENGLKLKKNARISQIMFFEVDGDAGAVYGGIHHRENLV